MEHNKKIMGYTGNSYEEFMALFTDEEVAEMYKWLGDSYDFSYQTEKEARESIIAYYVIEWLCEQIRDNTISGTDNLYRLWRKVL